MFDQRGLDIPPSFNFQCLPLCLQYKTQNSFREDNLRVADEDGGRFGSERVNAPQKREGKKRIMEIKSCMSRDQAWTVYGFLISNLIVYVPPSPIVKEYKFMDVFLL